MKKRPLTDREMLTILDMRDEGLSAQQIAERVGRTRNSVLGAIHRVNLETEPSRHDGTLPARWRVDGLERQEAAAR